ncbi:gluconate 2-dehydrogenase subunit 3 family protein [Mucilaginibacter antarcticus]
MLAGGGILLLPACVNDEGAVSVPLKNISITSKQELLLADITETIIPKTNTPGAKELNLHHFVLKMFDDCYDATKQAGIVAGLKQFNDFAKDSAGDNFIALATNKKLQLLKTIAKDATVNADLKLFLTETRKLTIKGYSNSKYVLTKLRPYELVPGRFHGCVPVNKAV